MGFSSPVRKFDARVLLPLALLAGRPDCGPFDERDPPPPVAVSDAGQPEPREERPRVPYGALVEARAREPWSNAPLAECARPPVPAGLPVKPTDASIACTDHSQCPAHTQCTAAVGPLCTYPHAEQACDRDEDCWALEWSTCRQLEQICQGPGACREIGRFCHAWRLTPCMRDADCTEAADGRCERAVFATSCSNDECLSDADCPWGTRCVCNELGQTCQPSNCARDIDCPGDQKCVDAVWVQTQPKEAPYCNGGTVPHLFCSTKLDECAGKGSCPSDSVCGYDQLRGHFACLPCAWLGGP